MVNGIESIDQTHGVTALADEQYVLLTTFRRNGTPVATALWVVPMASGELGFWTDSSSGKVKRLRHTVDVTVQPCNRSGKPTPGTAAANGTARLVDTTETQRMVDAIKQKYGLLAKLIQLSGSIKDRFKPAAKRSQDIGIAVRLTD
jgi:uncharacterized protein